MIRNPELAKHIPDTNWREFVRQIEYKGEWAARHVVNIEQWFLSFKHCSCCGFAMDTLPLEVRG